jgi:CubicO group peptidase (beta-lactamase class C family)
MSVNGISVTRRGDSMRRIFKISIAVISILGLVISSLIIYQSIRIRSAEFDWLEGEPEDYGFKWNKIAATYLVAERMPFLRSVLIVRDGTLLVEWYFNDGSRFSAEVIHSASKSFMSALIGIAFREGYLTDLDQKMLDYFPEYISPELDPRKHDITIRHLLQMKAGFNFNDSAEDWIAYSRSLDWVKYAIELPLTHNPGENWHYSTPQTNLLSAILTKASGMTSREFAEQFLFDPLEITIDDWLQDPQGYYTGGHEMYFTPRNLTQIGLLYVNNGSLNGQQIVPSEWVQESIQDYAVGLVEKDVAMTGGMESDFYKGTGYGYQWWLKTIRGYKSFSARGLGGQLIFCFPELDMVVVTTASGSLTSTYPGQYEGILDLIEKNILGSVMN